MFVSLGTGFYQIPLLNALKNLEIPIIGIDQNLESIGKNLCDIFFSCSLLDKERIIEILKPYRKHLKGIYSRSYGKFLETANELANYFGLPANPDPSIQIYRNKKEVLKLALNDPYLYKQKDRIQKLEQSKKWVVKSISSYGKINIDLIENLADFKNSTSFYVEPFYEGNEYIFFGLIINRKLYPLVITQKEIINFDYIKKNPETKPLLFCDKKHFYPSNLTDLQKYKIFQISNYIVKKTNLVLGPFLAEFIVHNDDIFFIEAVPEVGGEFIADYLIPEILNLPYFEFLVQILMNENLESIKETLTKKLLQSKEKVFLINYIFQKEGCFQNLQFPETFWKSKYYFFQHILKKKGDFTKYKNKNLDRIAVFGLLGDSLQDLIETSNQIENDIIIEYQ